MRTPDRVLLQELDVTIEGRCAYILNVLRAQTYYRGTLVYGHPWPEIDVKADGPRMVKDGWIDVTGVNYLFQEPPRSLTVRIDRNLGWETRTYVTRREPPQLERDLSP